MVIALPVCTGLCGRTCSRSLACQRGYDRAWAYNEELAERVRANLADRTDVEEKKMFGGPTFMGRGPDVLRIAEERPDRTHRANGPTRSRAAVRGAPDRSCRGFSAAGAWLGACGRPQLVL